MKFAMLWLVGPMQSWGTRSRFRERDTERDPSKSGVVGLMANALGRDRHESLAEFGEVTIAIRVDREGVMRRDFQTAENVALAKGGVSKDPQISNRYYLADAAFLVAVGSTEEHLKTLVAALSAPKRPLYLGRKGYVPSCALVPADPAHRIVTADSSETALTDTIPLLPAFGSVRSSIRMVLPDDGTAGETRSDEPVSFEPDRRTYRERPVRTVFINAEKFPPGEVLCI